MSKSEPVAVVVGSLRRASYSRRVAQALIERAPRGLDCRMVEIGDLPLYNEDLDGNAPPAWSRFRNEMRNSVAVLFVTPEYNRSIPGCLKNALDVGSRPPEKNVFDGVPAAVVSVTPYKLGAFGANHALRQTFVFLNMPVMQQPEAYLGKAGDLFDPAGKLKDGSTDELLRGFMQAFERWVVTIRAGASHDFEGFLAKRREVAASYVRGDTEPLVEIATQVDPATFFSPSGDTLEGSAVVLDRYRSDAKGFHGDNSTRLEVLQSGAAGDLAFWTGLQHTEMEDNGRRVPMTLRVTELFRFEGGSYKLVHRHADAKTKRG